MAGVWFNYGWFCSVNPKNGFNWAKGCRITLGTAQAFVRVDERFMHIAYQTQPLGRARSMLPASNPRYSITY